MRSAIRIGLYAILPVALTAIAAAGVAARVAQAPLGSIVQKVRSNGSVDIAGTGSTIYAGDRLTTEAGEELNARLGELKIYIAPRTIVEVGGFSNDPSVTFLSGSAVFSLPDRHTFRLQADGIAIRPLHAQGAEAQVAWKNAHALEVASISGGLQVSMGDEIHTLMPGEAYRIEIETETPEPQGSAGPRKGAVPTGKSHFTKYSIAAVVAATIIGTWRALVSPCAP